MTFTTSIAVLGLTSGVVGSVLGVMNYRRDRAIITLGSSTLGTADGTQYVVIVVRNEGRQGVTLTDAGLVVGRPGADKRAGVIERLPGVGRRRWIRRIRREGVFYSELAAVVDDAGEVADCEPFLEPGHHLSVRVLMRDVSLRGGGRPVWPCAEVYTGESFFGTNRVGVPTGPDDNGNKP